MTSSDHNPYADSAADCYCEDCEGLLRLHRHRPDSCLFDGDQLRGDGGYGPRQHRWDKR